MLKFRTKNALLGYFCAGIRKQYYNIWNLYLRVCLIEKFYEKTKIPKFGSKNALFGYFWPKISTLDWNFKKLYCHIWNQRPRIVLVAKFGAKVKIFKFETVLSIKYWNAWFKYFWAGTWKWYCYIWNQHSRICLIAKFCEKMEMPQFGTKIVLFFFF